MIYPDNIIKANPKTYSWFIWYVNGKKQKFSTYAKALKAWAIDIVPDTKIFGEKTKDWNMFNPNPQAQATQPATSPTELQPIPNPIITNRILIPTTKSKNTLGSFWWQLSWTSQFSNIKKI